MLRRRLFDKLQDITDFSFVDLCAGSGAVGIEAISRGARKVIFVDIGKKQTLLISKNLKRLEQRGCHKNHEVRCMSSLKWLEQNLSILSEPTIIFFDPPYNERSIYIDFLKITKRINKGTLFLVELSNKTEFYDEVLNQLKGESLQVICQGDKTIFWF